MGFSDLKVILPWCIFYVRTGVIATAISCICLHFPQSQNTIKNWEKQRVQCRKFTLLSPTRRTVSFIWLQWKRKELIIHRESFFDFYSFPTRGLLCLSVRPENIGRVKIADDGLTQKQPHAGLVFRILRPRPFVAQIGTWSLALLTPFILTER